MAKKETSTTESEDRGLLRSARRRAIASKAYFAGDIERLRRQAIEEGGCPWRILRYRRVVDPRDIPFPINGDTFITPQLFDVHARYLAKHCQVIPLVRLIEMIDNYVKVPEGTVALTFDEGHADTFLYGVPILAKYGLPATFFLPTGYIESGELFVDDRITYYVCALLLKGIEIPDLPFVTPQTMDALKPVKREADLNLAAVAGLLHELRLVQHSERQQAIIVLTEAGSLVTELPQFEDFMRWDDVRKLSQLGFDIGTMGHFCAAWPSLPVEEFASDVVTSVNLLVSQEVPPEEVFAFPQGLFTAQLRQTLTSLQFRYAAVGSPTPEPRFQEHLPMLLGRQSMGQLNAHSVEIFACRLWSLKLSGVQF
ncbi:MAG: polysaccharide deacetylase family protein [Bdellovibrionales bacterium]|nr:polysaccharide deacetylase family protein [Bdellovibrionales bacterium]